MQNFVVIGGSTGIGLSISNLLAKEHNVYATFNKTQIVSTQNNLQYNHLNVLDENFNLSFLPSTIDGLVYCPGAINLKPFNRAITKDFVDDYQIQVLGAIKAIQACLPNLKNSNQSSIVLFSTVAVQTGFNFHSIVSASKGAIEGLTKALSAEFAPKIRVNCIAPSLTKTPLANNLLNNPEKIESNAQRHPLKKVGEPEDIANLASFLLTPISNWITGQILHVDGGMSTIR